MELLTVDEVAGILRLHATTVRDWLRSGKLRGIKISTREWRIPREALDEFLQGSQSTKNEE